MQKWIGACLLLIGLCACEKETYVAYVVENQSATTVTVDGRSIIHGSDITLDINSATQKTIAHWKKYGKQTALFEPTSVFGDDLVITNAQGDTLRKDYKKLENWIAELQDARAVVSHAYILRITDADF